MTAGCFDEFSLYNGGIKLHILEHSKLNPKFLACMHLKPYSHPGTFSFNFFLLFPLILLIHFNFILNILTWKIFRAR